MTYITSINSNPISPSDVSLREFTIAADTTLYWPFGGIDTTDVMSRIMIVTASASSLSLVMAAGNSGPLGYTSIITNVGSNTFTVKDNSGGVVTTITAGQTKVVSLRTNSTTAGTWLTFTLGTGTSSADASLLAGMGLKAITTTLNSDTPSTTFSSGQNFGVGDRAKFYLYTGGASTCTFTSAVTLTNGWWMALRNGGTGSITLDPDGTETINGASTETLNTSDSCLIFSNGTSLYTVGIGRSVNSSDSQLSKSVAGGTDVTLTSTEAANNVIVLTGIITANINVIFPVTVKNYFITNNTTGSFTITCKTAAGTGVVVPQTNRRILTVDGTNMVFSNDSSGSGTITSITAGTGLNGGTITTSGTINLANTAVTAGTYGGALGVHSSTVDAQGRLTATSFTARSVTGTSNRITVTNGDGVSGSPTIDISSAYVGQNTITTLGTITTGVWNGTPITTLGTVTTGVWNGTDVAVADGGTGVSTLTAYAPIFGGTTGTGAVQSGTVGTAGQILTSNGAGALPTFQAAPSSGSMIYLATYTASSSATLDITSVLSSTYDDYVFILNGLCPDGNVIMYIRTSTDNGATWDSSGTDYKYAATGHNTSASGASYASNGANAIQLGSGNIQNNDSGVNGEIKIFNVNNTTKDKMINANLSAKIQGVNLFAVFSLCGVRASTSAINAVQFLVSSGNLANGTVKVYGIKKS